MCQTWSKQLENEDLGALKREFVFFNQRAFSSEKDSFNIIHDIIVYDFILGSEDGSEEDEDELMDQQYLYDSLKWDGGHFDCECVYTNRFMVHSRLKTMSGPRPNTTAKGKCGSF